MEPFGSQSGRSSVNLEDLTILVTVFEKESVVGFPRLLLRLQ